MPTTPDTWSTRDLPVLAASVAGVDAEPVMGVRFQHLAETTGLDLHDVWLAAKALERDGLVVLREYAGGPTGGSVRGVSGEAHRLVGMWPTEVTALDRMIAALEAIADNTDDEDTRTRARKVLDGLSGAGRTIGLSVATAAITGQIPGAGS